ncbi:MAG: peptidoglycan peptidase [Deltaproteobacteria bacterium]|nr:peptidoglycan peptidase [Deltaproteobacteria bacterium]
MNLIKSKLSEVDLPPIAELRTGDLIVQTSGSSQSLAIGWATGSLYTHMGMVRVYRGQAFVIEAVGPVRIVSLERFIRRGKLSRYSIYRHGDVDDKMSRRIWRNAKKYLGRSYDLHFSFANSRIYCSELVFLAYKKGGIVLGSVEELGELNLGGPFVDKILKKRWRGHPACKKAKSFEQCEPLAKKATLITPASIVDDKKLRVVTSTY